MISVMQAIAVLLWYKVTDIQYFILLGTVLAGVIWQRVNYHRLNGSIDRMSDDLKHFYPDLGRHKQH